jgi:hypothetical protein
MGWQCSNDFTHEAIRHNFIHIFKSITRQTGGKVRRAEFDSWMDEVNRKTLEAMKR